MSDRKYRQRGYQDEPRPREPARGKPAEPASRAPGRPLQDAAGPLYRVGVRGRIIRELDAGALAARLRGATLAEARAALSTRDGLSTPAQIEIWPDWAPRAFRLQVFQVRTE